MTQRWGLPEQHLLPDAVVAFVDGEMSRTVHDRVAAHMLRCPGCAAEIVAQRQARAAVQAVQAPSAPAALLAALRAIPQEAELPAAPEGLAVTEDGQLVSIQRADRMPFGSSAPLGSSPKLGEGRSVLGRRIGRRSTGAGVVVSGLVLGALALVNSGSVTGGQSQPRTDTQRAGNPGNVVDQVSFTARRSTVGERVGVGLAVR